MLLREMLMGSPQVAPWEAQWVEKQRKREVLVSGLVRPQDRSARHRALTSGWRHRSHSVGRVLLVVTLRPNFTTPLGPLGQSGVASLESRVGRELGGRMS